MLICYANLITLSADSHYVAIRIRLVGVDSYQGVDVTLCLWHRFFCMFVPARWLWWCIAVQLSILPVEECSIKRSPLANILACVCFQQTKGTHSRERERERECVSEYVSDIPYSGKFWRGF